MDEFNRPYKQNETKENYSKVIERIEKQSNLKRVNIIRKVTLGIVFVVALLLIGYAIGEAHEKIQMKKSQTEQPCITIIESGTNNE